MHHSIEIVSPRANVLQPALERTVQLIGKRVIDVAIASALLLALLPAFAVIALLIKLSSPGPVLFCQERVGRNGQRFRMFKFRTMVRNAEAAADGHRAYYAALIRGEAQRIDGKFKLASADRRVTRVGRHLRRYSLDELPQLINVVRGEMSLVGPRPAIPYEVNLYGPRELGRLAARPGLTGLWQISGRSLLDFEQMVSLDLAYIAGWSLWRDIVILVRTPLVVLTGWGAD